MIPLSTPNLKGNELRYVSDAIESEWVSSGGNYVKRFEEEMATYLNMPMAVACQSGTAALHMALLLSGVKKNDEVIVPTLTFIAAVNPVRYLGAEPIFMDCDETLNMDVEKLRQFLEQMCTVTNEGTLNIQTGKRIKAIVVVHVFGNMARMDEIMELAKRYRLKVVEDATEALGTYDQEGAYKGKFAGTIGDFGAYSFNGNKIITTGGGGMLVGKEPQLIEKAKYLSTQAKDDELYYTHHEIGYNYRMTNVQAAIGVAQLEVLEKFIAIKISNYQCYNDLLKNEHRFRLLGYNLKARNNCWFYSLLCDKQIDLGMLMGYLREKGIQTRPIWGLIHEQAPYRENQSYQIKEASFYVKHIINLPCSTHLTEKEIAYIVEILQAF